jgi:glutaredoxin
MNPIQITVFRRAGTWGPFKVSIPCGECTPTKDVILDTMANELAGVDAELDMRDWLSEWWKPLLKGGWHPPIVMVEGRIIGQGAALNRGVLTQAVIEAHARRSVLQGTHLFGKPNCLYCKRAKSEMDVSGRNYGYHDVVAAPRAMYEVLARVKPLVGPKAPITTPQIWLDGEYVGALNNCPNTCRAASSHNWGQTPVLTS